MFRTRREPQSFRRSLFSALVVPMAFLSSMVASQGIAQALGVADSVEPVQAPQGAADSAALRVARLVESHDCWTGASPYGDSLIPGHSVVTLPGRQARLMASDVGFAIWLDGKPGTLHAFCR